MAGSIIKMQKMLLSGAILAVLLIVTSCFDDTDSLLTYVPANSAAIVIVDWQSARLDPDLKRMINGRDFESQFERFGIQSNAIHKWLVFATLGSEAGLIIAGDFEATQIESNLASSGWTASELNGEKTYSRDMDVLWLPSDGMIVGGPKAGVLAAMQTSSHSRENIETAENFQSIRDQLATEYKPIVGYLIAPKGTLEAADAALSVTASAMSLFGMGEIGTILSTINIASGVGTAIGKNQANTKCSVDFCVMMRDEGTATLAAGTLNAMKALSSIVSDPSETENLESFEILQYEKTLSIRMEMPIEMLMPPR